VTLFHRVTVYVALTFGLAACGGGGGSSPMPQSYTIGGAVSGLAAGESVTLADNGSDTLSVSGNTTFVFPTKIGQNGSYTVTVTAQPAAQNCAVSAGSGSGLTVNVTTVAVTCTNLPQYAYVVNNGDNTISQYVIQSDGTLPGTVSEYAIGTDGALTLIGTVTAGPKAFMIATAY
jgi:hypothetical protein